MSGADLREVTKDQFREVYFRLGGKFSGWTAEYWQKFFEDEVKPGWKFMVEEPRSSRHDQMWIVDDKATKEYRLFFLTDDATEDVFDHPGRE